MMGEQIMADGDAKAGRATIDWVRRSMPLSAAAMAQIAGATASDIGIALPIDPATASLCLLLKEAGNCVNVLTAGAPVAASDLLAVMDKAGVVLCNSVEEFLARDLDLLLDTDGALLVQAGERVKGGTISALKPYQMAGQLLVPALHLGGSLLLQKTGMTHGIAQACVSVFLDITNLQIAGQYVLVFGYKAVGVGLARYARAYGARVLVCEADPVKAVQAKLDGHEVCAIDDALSKAAVVFCAGSGGQTLTLDQVEQLPEGASICWASRDDSTVAWAELQGEAPGKQVRDFVTEHQLANNRRIKVICEGQPLHEHTALGMASEYADIQLAAQIHAIAELSGAQAETKPGLQQLPDAFEQKLAIGLLG